MQKNAAAEFDLDMSLSEEGIAGMLEEYERDYHTGIKKKQVGVRKVILGDKILIEAVV
ncbi:MAG: hypothetical protein HFG97_01200 [Dorea sp.]|nr:hypothetical protein [Dorea sp.]